MRVLAITNLYPSVREPTRGVFNSNAFRALSRRYEMRVVSPRPWWTRIHRPGEWLRTPGDASSGVAASFPTYWSVPGRVTFHARAMAGSLRPCLRQLRREFPFDIILAAWACPDGVAAARLAEEMGCPLVTMVLGSDLNEQTSDPSLSRQIAWGLRRAQRVVAVSQALRDRAIALGIPPERVLAHHNGVNGERFRPRDRKAVRLDLQLPVDRPIICYVGNMEPVKGTDILIEAMGHLKRSGDSEALLVLVGGGSLEEGLRNRVGALGLETTVRFIGRRPHEEIPDWIASCDALCLPSRREGCPNVVLEALASGRPVVASRVGGVPELIDSENGILVVPEDPAALAAGLRASLRRSWEPASLRSSVEFLSWDAFGDAIGCVLDDAAAEWRASQRASSV